MQRITIEIKARSTDHEKVRKLLLSHGADFKGTDRQIDTYFNAHHGRLKLREGSIENFLVFYERENTAGPKQSAVTLFKNDPASPLKDILTRSLGILIVVDKTREIYFIDNIKFHIDTVAHLGTSVEIEAIDADGTIGKEKLLEQCNTYRHLLGISENDLVSVSYSDLLLEKNRQ